MSRAATSSKLWRRFYRSSGTKGFLLSPLLLPLLLRMKRSEKNVIIVDEEQRKGFLPKYNFPILSHSPLAAFNFHSFTPSMDFLLKTARAMAKERRTEAWEEERN
jgi:hypothetical protein